tara:strand:+ start:1965 stop:2867 length:903 start_codon:yes stop_codon:yes gene_type:complete
MVKHFLDISDFNKIELRKILNFAKKIKKKQIQNKNISILKNKSLGLLFEKQSTRTRLSFSVGMQKIGGNIVELEGSKIGFGTREKDEDMLKVMSQYLDALMIRNDNHKQLINLASLNILPIINGLSNYSHPCQILSDIFTIEECLGKIENKKIVWLGDANNVLISLIHSAEIFNFRLNILVPASLLIKLKKIFKNYNFKYTFFCKNFDLALNNADCVMTDAWISMGEKMVKEKKNILKKYQVNKNIMQKSKKNSIFMHCLPAHRNEEVTDEVIDGPQSVVWQQAQNRMYVQQSILNYLIK